jgi:hypothetical protein
MCVCQELLGQFDGGHRAACMALWQQHIPEVGPSPDAGLSCFAVPRGLTVLQALRHTDATCQRLEFYLNVYFAIVAVHPYPILPIAVGRLRPTAGSGGPCGPSALA